MAFFQKCPVEKSEVGEHAFDNRRTGRTECRLLPYLLMDTSVLCYCKATVKALDTCKLRCDPSKLANLRCGEV